MSSSLDSEVYAERQRLPGVMVSIPRLMLAALWSVPEQPRVTLTLEYRPDVDSSQWWTLRWGENGDEFISSKELEVCLFRAAVILRRTDERAKKYAGIPIVPPDTK